MPSLRAWSSRLASVICQVDMPTVAVGFNIELGDADTRGRHTTPLPRARDATCGLRHEKWLAGRTVTCSYANCHTPIVHS